MFENLGNFFKRIVKTTDQKELGSKDAAKERLHLVLMQDRANVSADFLELMKQEIIDVIKKYIIVDESAIDVRLTNQSNEDGTNGAPALYANIPIINIKNDMKADKIKEFDGVDFNKNEEINNASSNKIKNEESIINKEKAELKTSKKKISEKDKESENLIDKKKIESKDTKKSEIKKQNKIEVQETKQAEDKNLDINNNENYEDEDDDDVTFDDLLKAAEEDDKKQKAKEEKKK